MAVGVAIIMQKSGIPDIDQANCMIKLESDGTFIVHSGGADIGTGLDTVVGKLSRQKCCAAVLRGTCDLR
ncbi:putative hypoxanthine oxidase [Serratia fonticola]|uniref:Putative hypoxanthine oxidase n=1 Tax=Serratia fonticola TaxID=47917 RepID=A0A4U9UBZ6_SERFO|nr:putative hypoxanthine oxidase [Serratia fonticola]